MAEESWHVPHTQEEGADEEKTKCVGRKKIIFYQSTPLFMRDVQAVESLKHKSRFDTVREGDGNSAKIKQSCAENKRCEEGHGVV